MSVWLVVVYAECIDCDVKYESRNGMGLIAKHCKKMGHKGSVDVGYGVDEK